MPERLIVRLCCDAMATRFEVALCGGDPARLRAAAEAALAEVKRLDTKLSRFRLDSEISRINRLAASEPVKVEPWLFDLLADAIRISGQTEGAFDITVTPLMALWGFPDGKHRVPGALEVQSLLELVGFRHVILDADMLSVRFDREGVCIDLGGIGKGYAVDRAVEVLIESGVSSALVNGGASSVRAIGVPAGEHAWRVGVRHPSGEDPVEIIDLQDSALAVSAVHGRSFSKGGLDYGHVIDPRTGRPVEHTLLAAVTGPSAMTCDALSTAVLTTGNAGIKFMTSNFADYHGRVVSRAPRS